MAGVTTMAGWSLRRWGVAVVAAALAALATGVPTGIVETGFYTRMTPVTWWNYPVWAASAALAGLIAATYVRDGGPRSQAAGGAGSTLGATLLTAFAVGCPVCNKLVVALIGVSGALGYWAPLQPALGVFSIAILGAALALRLRGAASCAAPAAAETPAAGAIRLP